MEESDLRFPGDSVSDHYTSSAAPSMSSFSCPGPQAPSTGGYRLADSLPRLPLDSSMIALRTEPDTHIADYELSSKLMRGDLPEMDGSTWLEGQTSSLLSPDVDVDILPSNSTHDPWAAFARHEDPHSSELVAT